MQPSFLRGLLLSPDDPSRADETDAERGHGEPGAVAEVTAELASLWHERPSDYWQLTAGFHTNPCGFLLGATGEGTTSLVLPTDWGGLEGLIARAGGQVVSVGGSERRLAYGAEREAEVADRVAYLRVEEPATLPFSDGGFDTVVMDLASMRALGLGRDRAADPLEVWLAESARVLRPGGRLVLLAPNRARIRRGAGTVTSHWSPDRAPGSESPAPFAGHTRGTYTRRLRSAGLEVVETYLPWPSPWGWESLTRFRDGIVENGSDKRAMSLRHRAAGFAIRGLGTASLRRHLVPGFCFVAAKTTTRTRSPSTLERIAHRAGADLGAVEVVAARPGSGSLVLSDGARFIKVPLTEHATELLRTEVAIARRFAESDENEPALAVPGDFVCESGIRFVVYPHVEFRPDSGLDDEARRLETAVERLGSGAAPAPLNSTDFWSRIMARENRDDLAAVGAGDLIEWVEQRADRVVPVGVVHGDMVPSNVLRRTDGSVVLIDWSRSERHSPVLLDAVRACHMEARRHLLERNEAALRDVRRLAWDLMLDRTGDMLLYGRVDAVRGELDWGEAVALTLLDLTEWDLRTTRGNPVFRHPALATVRGRIELVRSAVRT